MTMRFPIAFQIVLRVALEARRDRKSTSAELAKEFGLDASFIRQLVGTMIQSDILRSSKGRGGRVTLAKPEHDIKLREIYLAVWDEARIWSSHHSKRDSRLRNSEFAPLFRVIECEAEVAIVNVLRDRSVADALSDISSQPLPVTQPNPTPVCGLIEQANFEHPGASPSVGCLG